MRRLLAAALISGFGMAPAALAQAPTTPPLKVVVTTKAVHALALQVLDGVADPVLVVDGAASPHTYALKPSDAKLFNDANLVIRISEGVEPFTARVVKSLPKAVQVLTLETAKGVDLLPRRSGATYETHAHASHEGHKHGQKHKHGQSHGSKDKNTKEAMDGHFWLDPANAKVIVTEIARVAQTWRPAMAERILANTAKAAARLDALDAELATLLAPAKGVPYVVFHDALQYFESHYGLTPVGSITVDPDVPPSAKRLTDIRNKIKTLSASCVFAEPGYETKVVQSVIEGTSARTGTLDPEALGVSKGVDAYDNSMRRLAQGMRTCLAPNT